MKYNIYKHPMYDIMFKKLRAVLGGNVMSMMSCAAPISDEVKDFFKIAFSCPIIEGYG